MKNKISHWIIEGADRLGKSSLIQGIIKETGYHHVIHYSKPVISSVYNNSAYDYQYASFQYGFDLLGAKKPPVIFDRFHLGEVVYSPLYRNYIGDYVFSLEKDYNANKLYNIKLILLTSSDLSFQKDDGDSFDWSKRKEEQDKFINAFDKSIFPNKVLIDINAGGTYKPFDVILNEALK